MSINEGNTRRKFMKVNGSHKWIAGICGGIAYALGVPALFVRIGFVVVFICLNPYLGNIGMFSLGAYLIFWIWVPRWVEDPDDYDKRTA